MKERIYGLDLSLSSTGLCVIGGEKPVAQTFAVKTRSSLDRYERLRNIRDYVRAHVANASLVVLEDQPTHTPSPATLRALAELHGVIGVMLHEEQVPVARVNVSTLKRYALGKGVGKKGEIGLSAYKYFDKEFDTDDECDAFWLACMGLEHIGVPVLTRFKKPLPQTHRDALAKVEWPALVPQA